MDQKQFDLFKTGIQWVKDEAERPYSERPSGVAHNQSTWGWGKVKDAINRRLRKGTSPVRFWIPVCPTSCCLAGNIVLANGDEFVVPEAIVSERTAQMVNVDYCMDAEGEVYNISARAQQVAGLTGEQAASLFDGNRSATYLITHAQVIAERNGYDLDLV